MTTVLAGWAAHDAAPLWNTLLLVLTLALILYGQHASRVQRKLEFEAQAKQHSEEMELLEQRIKAETPAALLARMESIELDRGSFARRAAQVERDVKQVERDLEQVHAAATFAKVKAEDAEHKFGAVEIRVEDRLAAQEQLIKSNTEEMRTMLTELREALRGLACAERSWHEGEKPGICPLYRQACPLNGKGEDAQ